MAESASKSKQVGLRVLALHGNGLQALGIISIVDELCSQIAQQNHQTRCPAPCQLFDVICGTGVGALIAILFGRYCLDISRCKQVYMDLMDFVEEQRQARVFSNKCVSREDIQCFLETLIREEGWSDTFDFPVVGDKPRCRHVFVVQQPRNSSDNDTAKVHHGFGAHKALPEQMSESSEQKILGIGSIVAKATVHPANGWVPIFDTNSGDNTATLYFHETVFIALEEIAAAHDAIPEVSFIASVGPSQSKQNMPLDMSHLPKSPAQWVVEKTSPIRSAVMWPLRATLKTLSISGSKQDCDQHFEQTQRKSSTNLGGIADEGETAAFDPVPLPQKKQRRTDASARLCELLESASGRAAFNLPIPIAPTDHDWEDMTDLRDTRSQIRDAIDAMEKTGLLQEAARQFGPL